MLNNNRFDIGYDTEATIFGAVSSGIIGGFSGLLGGDGVLKDMSMANLRQMEKQFLKNVFSKGAKGVLKQLGKQAGTKIGESYVGSIVDTLQITAITLVATIVSHFVEVIFDILE